MAREPAGVSLLSYIDLVKIEKLQNAISAATGVSLMVVDAQGRAVTQSPSSERCARIRDGRDTSHNPCQRDIEELLLHSKGEDGLVVRSCHAGLTHFASPILNFGGILFYVAGGQVIHQEPSSEALGETAKALGMSAPDFQCLLQGVPVVSKHVLRKTAELFEMIAVDVARNCFLVTGMAHELRGSLTSIKGRAGHLQSTYGRMDMISDDLVSKYFLDISAECDLIDLVIQGVQSTSVYPEEYSFERVGIFQEVIIPVLNMHKAQGGGKRLRLEYKGHDNFPHLKIDAKRLRQVFHNLLSNAVKYSRKGSTITAIGFPGKEVHRFAVTNYGVGVPAGWEQDIFELGKRAPNAVVLHPHGQGLGLAISRAIAEAHGGSLELSRSENPTIFTLVLPAR